MDLIVNLNFRMDSSALYSDIVLPAASWYEKADLNSTDMHSFIHPLSRAIAPVWEVQERLGDLPQPGQGHQRGGPQVHARAGQKDILTVPIATIPPGRSPRPR